MAKERCKKWKDDVVQAFAEVLADVENGFANALEMLALKRSANTEVFEHIKREFEKKLHEREIVGVVTDIAKLRKKYATLKSTWKNFSAA